MPDEGSLFRPEAIEASRNRTGGPVNNQGVATWAIVAFMTTLFVCAVIFISIARYTKKETVLGQVVPAEGVARVTPMREGIIKEVRVRSGQSVTQDQPLFSISYDPILEDGAQLAARINSKTEEQLMLLESEGQFKEKQLLQSHSLTRAKLAELRAELPTIVAQRDMQAERVAAAQKDVDRYNSLFEKGFVAETQLSQRRDNLLGARQRLLDMDESVEHHALSVKQLQSELANNEHALAATKLSDRRARSAMEGRQLLDLSGQGGQIVAVKAGQITNIQARQGDLVAPNQTLALIIPQDKTRSQQVILWVPSRAIGFVEAGNKVRLMFDAFPYQTFGVGSGRVSEISLAPIMPNELPIPIETKEQMYKVVVDLDRDTLVAYGRAWPLKAGMRLSADLVLDEKSLLGWLLDPLTAMRNRAAR